MPSNNAALIVAISGAAVSLSTLVWQLCLFRLSGARLQVLLIPARIDSAGTVVRGPQSGWKQSPGPRDFQLTPWIIELAQVSVTNIGRTPVSVSNIGLDFGRETWWKRRSRHTLTALSLPLANCSNDEITRLDAGATMSRVVQFAPLLRYGLEQRHGKPLRVRATATPAGRRTKRSRRRRKWTFRSGETFAGRVTPLPDPREQAAFEEFWGRLAFSEGGIEKVRLMWDQVRRKLPEAKNGVELVRDVAETFPDDTSVYFAIVFAFFAYEKAAPGEPSAEPSTT